MESLPLIRYESSPGPWDHNSPSNLGYAILLLKSISAPKVTQEGNACWATFALSQSRVVFQESNLNGGWGWAPKACTQAAGRRWQMLAHSLNDPIALALDGRPGVGWRGGTKQRSGIEAKMLQWDSLRSNPSSPASITYYLWDIGKFTSLLLPQFLHRQNVDDNSTYLIGAIVRIKWAEMGDVLSTLHVIIIINCLLSGIYSKSYLEDH